jgi:AraC-like DNA-binding protein
MLLARLLRLSANLGTVNDSHFLEALRSPRPPSVDPRVATASDTLRRSSNETASAEVIAKAVGLSTSRLEHLFKEQIGTPMRSFRTWCRFSAAAVALATGCDLTSAAQEAGFYDQAHFTKTFRQWFGVTPSFVFSPGLSIHVMSRA